MPDENSPTADASELTELDPAQIQYVQQQLQADQNLPLAAVAGLGASLVGAALWAGVTVVSGYQIGFMAIGIGFLVGFAVRSLGKGITSAFGVLGAAFSLLGCALGNLLAVTALVAREQGVPFLEAVAQLDADLIQSLMVETFTPMDLLFYAVALYYGYKLSFRQITDADLASKLSGAAA
jgi:hypothetical protein